MKIFVVFVFVDIVTTLAQQNPCDPREADPYWTPGLLQNIIGDNDHTLGNLDNVLDTLDEVVTGAKMPEEGIHDIVDNLGNNLLRDVNEELTADDIPGALENLQENGLEGIVTHGIFGGANKYKC